MRTMVTFLTVFLLFVINNNAQTDKQVSKVINLHLKEFDLMVYPKKYPDTIIKKIDDTSTIKIYMQGRKWKSKFYIFNLKNRIIIEGEYANALKLTKTIDDKLSITGDLVKREFIEYYEPIKTGKWVYNNKIN